MNRGENYHPLRRAISYAGFGKLRFKTEYEQELWAECSRLIEAEARAHGKTLSMTTTWITRLSRPSQTFVSKGFGYSTGMTTLILDSAALKATAVQTTDDTLGSLLRFHPSASL